MSQPGRQGPPRQQAAPPRRRQRTAAGLDTHGRQPQRHHPAAGAARQGAAGARPCRPAEAPTRQRRRRPRLRPRQVPQARLAARDQAGDRPTPDRTRLRPRTRTLGRRTHLRLAAQPPPAARSYRPPPRNPRSVPRPRLLPDLLAPNRDVIQLELLSRGVPRQTWHGARDPPPRRATPVSSRAEVRTRVPRALACR